MQREKENSYKIGDWYMVRIGWDTSVPAKFRGFEPGCDRECPQRRYQEFPCPGKPSFEDVKIYDKENCGLTGAGERNKGFLGITTYTSFRPTFPPVSQDELWKVEAIRRFQEALAERIKSFSILLPDGSRFEGRIKPPKGKENPPGKYVLKIVNPETGETENGWFLYDGQSPSVRAFIASRRPGWHIKKVRRARPSETDDT